jgi:hypothetical protein
MKSNLTFITQDQYIRLCKKCNEILISKNSNLVRIATPWFHPIREHPIFLERYIDIFYKKGFVYKVYFSLKNRIKNFFIWVRQIYRSIFLYNSYWYTNDLIQPKVDSLFISHILDSSQLSIIEDFYFANIPSELVKRNHSVLIGYINSLDLSDRYIQKSIKPSTFTKVYFTNTLNIFLEFSIRNLIRKESRALKLDSKLGVDNITKDIYNYASNVIFNGETQAALRLYKQVRKLVLECNPKSIISLYEGHAYERICMAAARSINPNIVCISYQHTGTFRLSNSIKLQYQQQYNPNIILASGIECKEELSKLSSFQNIQIDILGSNRGVSNSIKKISKKNNQFICLVIPEGIVSECLFLLRFSLECALLNPDLYFIWRLHPSVAFSRLKSIEKKFINLPCNIILSDKSLDEDIQLSRWVLYRGSTAIFKAISCGLRPLYLRINGELTIDPLFNFKKWRMIIDSSYDFLEIIRTDRNNNFKDFHDNHKLALKLCKHRFSKIDIKVLDKILESI